MTEKFTEAEKAAEGYSKNYPWSMYGFTIAKNGFLSGIAYLKPQLEAERKRAEGHRAALDKIANGDTSEMDGTGDGWLPKQAQYEKIAQHAIAKTKETADE